MASGSNPLLKAWTPISIVLAVYALLGLSSDILAMEENLGATVYAFKSVTMPIADFLFGWIAAYFDFDLLDWHKNYSIVGLLFTAGYIRTATKFGFSGSFLSKFSKSAAAPLIVLLWPALFVVIAHGFFKQSQWRNWSSHNMNLTRSMIAPFPIFMAIVTFNLIALSAGLPAFQQ